MTKEKHRIFSLLLALIIILVSLDTKEPAEASAASKYITVNDFLKYLIEETVLRKSIGLDVNSKQPYVDAAIDFGFLKKGDFKNYNAYLNRTGCAVILNRLDESLNYKYNYPQEVYDLLSGCKYYDGRLYYNTKGSLYPKGATKDTYPAEQFYQDVIVPVLETTFKYDDWSEKGLAAEYEYVCDADGNVKEKYIEIGVAPTDKYDLSIHPFNDGSFIITAWRKMYDGDRKVTAVLKSRISDINKVPKNKREAVAQVYAKGIITGYSNGIYVQNRSFKGTNKITAADAKDAAQKVLNREKRSLISPEGNLIRTTKLPKNAKDYAYILECFPNEYYEMRYNFMYYEDFKSGKTDKSLYAYPKETDFTFLYNKFYKDHLSLSMNQNEYYETAISQAQNYLKCVFNMNYKTVDDKWGQKLASSYAQYREERINGWISDYIKAVKENHVVVESSVISIDPGSMYFCGQSLYIRAYVKYRISANSIDVNQDELIYGYSNNMIGLKKGEWRYGYYDIRLSSYDGYESGNKTYWGVDMYARISDFAFKGAY